MSATLCALPTAATSGTSAVLMVCKRFLKSSADIGGGGVDVLVVGAGLGVVEAAPDPLPPLVSVLLATDVVCEPLLPPQPAASPTAVTSAAIRQLVDVLMAIGMRSLLLHAGAFTGRRVPEHCRRCPALYG